AGGSNRDRGAALAGADRGPAGARRLPRQRRDLHRSRAGAPRRRRGAPVNATTPAPVAVHHVVDGPADAPVVVFACSLGATLATWEPQAAALARRFRVVRYDPRGHGRSPVPPGPYALADLGADLVGLLDRLGVERAHLCGLSMGAMTSL